VPYHVIQRGHRHEDVFFSTADRRRYLLLLGGYAQQHGLEVLAYCLMANHVHLVVVPTKTSSMGEAMRALDFRYAQYFNHVRGLTGRVWHNRYFSCPLDSDDRYFWEAIRYVERNPVRAGLVTRAENFEWSSAQAHCGLRHDPVLVRAEELRDSIGNWAEWLQSRESDDLLLHLRRCTSTGRPLGGDDFVDELEAMSGRVLRSRPRGRPRKPAGQTEGRV
jgi:putative transposase